MCQNWKQPFAYLTQKQTRLVISQQSIDGFKNKALPHYCVTLTQSDAAHLKLKTGIMFTSNIIIVKSLKYTHKHFDAQLLMCRNQIRLAFKLSIRPHLATPKHQMWSVGIPKWNSSAL